MNNKLFFTFQHISTIDDNKDRRTFHYNDTIYNLHILDNYVNKFLDIKLRAQNFFKKKGTNPIWGFQFDRETLNIFTKTTRALCKSGGLALIVYTIDDIDLKYAKSINQSILSYVYESTKNYKPRFIVPLSDIPFNKRLEHLVETMGDIFKQHPFDLDRNYICLPRLRKRNIKMIIPGIVFNQYFNDFNKSLTEEDFLKLLEEKGINLK